MPIRKVTTPGGGSGYKWGEHGKVYPTKKQAEEQRKAAYSAGYKGKK